MPRCEYMDMADVGDRGIQVVTRRRWRLRHGATIDSTRFDSEKMAMAVMQEGEKVRSGFEASVSPRSGDQQAGQPECRVCSTRLC